MRRRRHRPVILRRSWLMISRKIVFAKQMIQELLPLSWHQKKKTLTPIVVVESFTFQMKIQQNLPPHPIQFGNIW